MKCGHVAVATLNGRPACPMCIGIKAGATEVEDKLPNLAGRQAMCACRRLAPSNYGLPFFEYRPDQAFDGYYCGHDGWD